MLFRRKCQFDVAFCDFKSFKVTNCDLIGVFSESFKVANCDFRILLFDVFSEKIATFAA